MNIYSKSNHPQGFYVYAYLREDGTPYYVGKGKCGRAWDINHSIHLPVVKTNIVVLEANLSEVGALALERRMIRWYGRKDTNIGILRNGTDGGEGASGRKVTDSFRAAQSERMTGEKNHRFGKTVTIESNRMRSIKLSGRVKTPEHLRVIVDSRRRGAGYSPDQETKDKIAATNKIAMLGKNVGKKLSPETIQKRQLSREKNRLNKVNLHG